MVKFNPVKLFKDFLSKKALIKRQKRYMELLQAGGLFVDWIYKDIADDEKHQRAERRRFQHQLDKTGKLSSEMAAYYFNKLEQIIAYIEKYEIMKNAAWKQVKKEQKKPATPCKCGKEECKENVA